MLSREGTLLVFHPLQYSPLSDRSERLAETYRHAHTLTRTCYGYWRLGWLRYRCCLRRCVDVSNKLAFEIRWFKAIQWNNFWMNSNTVNRPVFVLYSSRQVSSSSYKNYNWWPGEDDLQWHINYNEVWLLLAELVGSLVDGMCQSLTDCVNRWLNDCMISLTNSSSL